MKKSKSVKSNSNNHHQHADSSSCSSKFSKFFDPDASWDKDQLFDVLHWIRQVVALMCGLLWGAIPVTGGIWIILFLLISSGLVFGYYAKVLRIDEEDYGGHWALLQEGALISFAVFVLSWVLVYNLVYF